MTCRVPRQPIYGVVPYNYISRVVQYFHSISQPAVARATVRNSTQKPTPHHGQMKMCNYLFFIKPIGIFYGHIWRWPRANARLRWLVFKIITRCELSARDRVRPYTLHFISYISIICSLETTTPALQRPPIMYAYIISCNDKTSYNYF